jgi:hypothetical protein
MSRQAKYNAKARRQADWVALVEKDEHLIYDTDGHNIFRDLIHTVKGIKGLVKPVPQDLTLAKLPEWLEKNGSLPGSFVKDASWLSFAATLEAGNFAAEVRYLCYLLNLLRVILHDGCSKTYLTKINCWTENG